MTPPPLQAFYRYWGKARPAEAAACHLLPYHCLDVAACASVLLRRHRPWRKAMAGTLDLSEESVPATAALILALHDLGKFTRGFQSKATDAMRHVSPHAIPVAEIVHHTHAGWVLWQTIKNELPLDLPEPLMRASFGHHGEPPSLAHPQLPRPLRVADIFGNDERRDALDFATAALDLLGPASRIVATDDAETASWWFAGIGIVADWLGSDPAWFPYRARPMPLADYWQYALLRAESAVQASGIPPQPAAQGRDWGSLFPFTPTPCQAAVAALPIDGPTCLVIEDVMGSGKTEAALFAAFRLMVAGYAHGMFFGLPTQATANALFTRIGQVYEQLFEGKTSLILTHSGRRFVDLGGDTATSRAAAWIGDMNKKALLAQVGVGTIDQALLAVMHTRHGSLRLAGLLGKVLVVDEVHAYDGYTNGLLEQLLEAHARFGGSAILLSATLDAITRARLLNAWRAGRRLAETKAVAFAPYPLLSVGHGPSVQEVAPRAADLSQRSVHIALCHNRDRLMRLIERAVRRGKCIAWVCNTVADAVATHDVLVALLGRRVHLLHSRFMQGHRTKLESKLIQRFGKAGKEPWRRGRVVVATQVIEQSLDVDFDILITDAAPVDAILQRIGRCQRHARGFRVTRVFIHSPPLDDPSRTWLRDWGRTAFVYEDHGRVWLSLRLLRDYRTLRLPEDARRLVDEVYTGDESNVPPALQAYLAKASSVQQGARARSFQAAIRIDNGYCADGTRWVTDADPTRDGRPSTELVLLDGERPLLRPLAAAKTRAPGVWSSNATTRVAPWEAGINVGRRAKRNGNEVVPRYDWRRGLSY